MSSLYEVLGIPPSADGAQIKAAYRRLARSCHPDVVSVTRKETSADEFIKIHAAYSTLSDPTKRADYDRERRLLHFVRSSSSSSSSSSPPSSLSHFPANYGYSTRNWETDQCW